jgi:hypothetical protein
VTLRGLDVHVRLDRRLLERGVDARLLDARDVGDRLADLLGPLAEPGFRLAVDARDDPVLPPWR